MDAQRRHTWQHFLWTTGVSLTILNGLLVGYGSVALQFFGESADAGDYRISAGAYAAAAAVLLLSLPALLARDRRGWLAPLALVAVAVLALLATNSAVSIAQAPPPRLWPDESVLDGMLTVLWAPWTWAMAAFGVRALARGLRGSAPRHASRAAGSEVASSVSGPTQR